MNAIRSRFGRSLILIAAILGASEVRPPLAATTCYANDWRTVCRCMNCTYLVICGGTIGMSPGLQLVICTGNNPGFVTSWYRDANSGADDYLCSLPHFCGTAVATSTCCGGARTSFADWSTFTICTPAGSPCSAGGTGTI